MRRQIRVLFLGGKQAGCIGLLTLFAAKCEITGVVAYDDMMKAIAEKLDLPTFPSIRKEECIKLAYKSDLIVSVHGREIVPAEILNIPPLGGINVHPCLYKYKGSKPVERLLKNGNTKASVGVHRMIEKVDAGKVITELFVDVTGKRTVGDVYNALYPYYTLAILEAIAKIQNENGEKKWLHDN